jgi:4-hydroxy-tetrahydrodipicolinate synthase
MMALISAFEAGNLTEARRLHQKLFPLCRDLLAVAANPIPVKTALAMLGRSNGEFRLPLCPPDERARETLRKSLMRYGLLTGVA